MHDDYFYQDILFFKNDSRLLTTRLDTRLFYTAKKDNVLKIRHPEALGREQLSFE